MTTQEISNLTTRRVDSRPMGIGHTILARVPDGTDVQTVKERIVTAWEAVARWGRWCDEELGEWPSIECCITQLPEWLQEAFNREPYFQAESWLDGIHDREWIWWDIADYGQLLKIDISTNSLPMSTWPLRFVIEKAGATIVFDGAWIPAKEAVNNAL